ncbi:MAG TPA: SPFH domain-containing protein [Patescibacteria group bacterium]|nr:SPFH domain-containing protein [Patescibacteria group bacterium]
MGIVLSLLVGILLFGIPIAASFMGHQLSGGQTITLMVLGGIIAFASAVALIFTRLYHKASASEAIVRTGMGKMQVVIDGGILAVPVVHTTLRIPLRMITIKIDRRGQQALRTKDNLLADVAAQFFLSIPADEGAITKAARKLGESAAGHENERILELVEPMVEGALRGVATQCDLAELNSDREAFVTKAKKMVTAGLEEMGFVLGEPTMSYLDQTDNDGFREGNVFDAQAARKIAEVAQAQRTAQTKFETEGDQARKQLEVEKQKKIYELELAQKKAEQDQLAKIAAAEAERSRLAQEAAIATARSVELATTEKMKAIEVAKRGQEQAVEVAAREKDAAIADAEAKRAQRQAEQAKAEALREAERQSIETVKVKATAEREKEKQVIDAKAAAEKQFVAAQRATDAEAYKLTAMADGKKASAEADATAITTAARANADATKAKAEAERDAEIAKAAGIKAAQMVPVDVAAAQVAVAAKQVAVDKERLDTVTVPELQARQEHGQVAQDFELAQLRITRDAEVRIATAQAMATVVGKIDARIVGTPENVGAMLQQIQNGMNFASLGNSLVETMSSELRGAVAQVLQPVKALAQAGAERLSGKKSTDTANAGGEESAATK